MANVNRHIVEVIKRRIASARTKKGYTRLPKPSIPRHPKPLQNTYFSDLKGVLYVMENILNDFIKQRGAAILRSSSQLRPTTDALREDDYSDDIKDLVNKAKIQFENTVQPKTRNRSIASKSALAVNEFNKKDTQRVFKSVLGVDVFSSEPWLEQEIKAYIADNVSYITSIEDTFFDRIEDTIFRAARAGDTLDNLTEQLQRDYDVTESKAAFIARDQVSKFNGQLTMLRQQAIGISKYIWSTSLDERVRDTHAEKEGVVFEWANPPADTGNPGEDYNCRCVAIPVFDDEEKQADQEVDSEE